MPVTRPSSPHTSSKTYWKYGILYVFVLGIGMLFVVWRFNTLQQQQLQENMQHQAEYIESAFNDTARYTENLLRYVAYGIVQNDAFENLNRLSASFDTFQNDLRLQKTLSWSSIEWADADHRVVLSANEGILQTPFNLSFRDYIPRTSDYPGTLQMGKAVLGSTSQTWVLPAGFGVNTKTGEYAGALVIGFDIEKYVTLLKPYIIIQDIKASLLDSTLQPVVPISGNIFTLPPNAPFNAWLKSLDVNRSTTASYFQPSFLRFGTSTYLYKLQNYPYIVFLSSDTSLTYVDIVHLVKNNASECLLIILFGLMILYALHRLIRIRPSLSQEYLIFVIITTGMATGMLIWLLVSFYTYQEEDKKYRYSVEAEKIVSSLSEQFNYVENIARFIGKKISVLKKYDVHSISNILGGRLTVNPQQQEIFSWSLFDFIDTNGNVTASATQGILSTPQHVINRSYMQEAPNRPWKLSVSQPSLGITSGEFVIPAAMAITAPDSRTYIGMLSMGFNVNRLVQKLESVLASESTQFVIVSNHDHSLILQSSGNVNNADNHFFVGKLDYIHTTNADAGILPHSIEYHGISYRYFRTLYDYPYTILIGENTHDLEHTFRTEMLPRIIECVGMWLFIVVLLFFFRLKIVAPLISLSDAAKSISEGKINTPVPHFKSIETGRLARSILQVKRAFLRESRLKSALHTAKNMAETANIAKTDFLSSTAHELRSPLNAIIGFASMIKHKVRGETIDHYTGYASDIEQSGYELLEFIGDLLDVNKSEKGTFAIEKEEWLDISNIIHRCIKLTLHKAHQSNIQLNTDIDKHLPKLYADSRRMRQVLINLLSNSIRYSPPDTFIIISAHKEENELVLQVTDQGFGMTPDQIHIALTKGGTAHHDQVGTTDSYGIGLPLTKHIVELHGATFHITSEVGKGTTVTMTFPKERIEGHGAHIS